MNTNIASVTRLKQEAKAARDFDDLETASAVLDKAISILKGDLETIDSSPESERTSRRVEIEKELADCFGMKGGLYRRAAVKATGSERDALLELAEKMYKQGAKLERNDSYNLTNTIVIPLIRNPERFYELVPKAIEARDVVERQVETIRATQWWAWADLGLLNLLAGEAKRALHAYAQFSRSGAQVKDCQSTINALQDLERSWPAGEVRDRFADAIAFLERQKAVVS